jgi:UDP-N-acetylglucosamine--N-acetylmuramyl-(pentapeptide) pyrophosphoryl-undecaprenol N-acetylglucosamine transferase
MPVRNEIRRLSPAAAREALGLDPARNVLAIFAGSQGSRPLNQWVKDRAAAFAAEGIQIYCVTGPNNGAAETLDLPAADGGRVQAFFVPFSDRVAELLSAADLVVARAGAGTISELIRCETPAILVPFPQSADDHQRANAAFFERQGGGIVVEQAQLNELQAEVLDTIFNDWLLRRFRSNLQRMDRANPLQQMLADLEEITAPPGAMPRSDNRPALA